LHTGSTSPEDIQRVMGEAVRHHQEGRLDQAETLYREVLTCDPRIADANHLLGLVAYQTGHFEEAAKLIGTAISLDDRQPSFFANLAVVLTHMRNWPEAVHAAKAAVDLDPGNSKNLNCLGLAYAGLGQVSEAEAAYERALELTPRAVGILINFGNLLTETKRPEEAAEMFRRALDVDPSSVIAHANLGVVLRALGDIDEAEASCHRALELDPGYINARVGLGNIYLIKRDFAAAAKVFGDVVESDTNDRAAMLGYATALAGLGRVGEAVEAARRLREAFSDWAPGIHCLGARYTEQGRLEDAVTLFRKAIELDPAHVDSYYMLAEAGQIVDAPWLGRLEQMAADTGIEADRRVLANFTLGLTRQSEPAKAFTYFTTGNRIRRQILNDHLGLRFDAEAHDRFIEEIEAVFSSDFFSHRAGWGNHSEIPVFVVGMPRSGTTLVERICAAHPDVMGVGELKEVGGIVSRVEAATRLSFPRAVQSIPRETVAAAADGYLSSVRSLAPGESRAVDKMPFNFLYLGLIATLFPRARIVHCVRDPRDTALSIFKQNFTDPLPWTTDLSDIGHYMKAYCRLMDHWRQVLPVQMLEVTYERLVAEQDQESRRLIEFLGLPWDGTCLNFHEGVGAVQSASKWQVRRPIYGSSVGGWRQAAEQLRPFDRAFGHDGD